MPSRFEKDPTDAAFDRLSADVLAALDTQTLRKSLTYQVVGTRVLAAKVVGLSAATTVEGGDVSIALDGSAVILNGVSEVTTTDIPVFDTLLGAH
ncbi:MAG: fasciclin domain-containing protein [Myxococcota bacterium]